jgi:hypothetical protein
MVAAKRGTATELTGCPAMPSETARGLSYLTLRSAHRSRQTLSAPPTPRQAMPQVLTGLAQTFPMAVTRTSKRIMPSICPPHSTPSRCFGRSSEVAWTLSRDWEPCREVASMRTERKREDSIRLHDMPNWRSISPVRWRRFCSLLGRRNISDGWWERTERRYIS